MLSCKDFSEMMSRSLDRGLGPVELVRLRTHLLLCPPCARLQQQMRFLHQAARMLETVEASGDGERGSPELTLSPEAREALLRALTEKREG